MNDANDTLESIKRLKIKPDGSPVKVKVKV